MDALAVLFGLGLLALLVIGVPYLLISHLRLKARVARLEAGLSQARPEAVAEVAPVVEERAGPWAVSPVVAPEASQDLAPPRAFVLRADRMSALMAWVRGNWALAVAGVSLALAGVFMVQYGVEQGLLTPFWRVIGALVLGATLIAAGERLRRRYGDEAAGAVTGLPSVLSGAGVIALFAGVLAARGLYDLIGPGVALAGLVGVGAAAVILGWFHGPVLTALGLIGAGVAPFMVGGQSDTPGVFYGYFAVLAAVGLAVDAARRWAWISVLALAISIGGATLLYLAQAGALLYLAFWAMLVVLTVLVPEARLVPQHAGNSLLRRVLAGGSYPDFPVRLVWGVVALASLAALWLAQEAREALVVWGALSLLAGMLAALILGTRRAAALEDVPVVPAVATLLLVALEGFGQGPVWSAFMAGAERLPEAKMPLDASVILTGGAVVSILCAFRARYAAGVVPVILWSLSAAVMAPGLALILELFWTPAVVLGAYAWALQVMALAALMVVFAVRSRGPEGAVAALFAAAALVLITLALFVVLSKAALTLALGLMILSTAVIDRRFNLPLLGGLAQVGVAVIGYRLVIDPGLDWAVREAGWDDVLLSHLGPLALLAAAWGVMAARAGGATRVVIESAVWSITAIFLSVVLQRWLGGSGAMGHAGLGLTAVVWLASSMVQLWRLRAGGRVVRWLRLALGSVMGAVALVTLVAQAVLTNPLVPLLWRKEFVSGPLILDTLAAAYLPVALVFALAAWKLDHLRRLPRLAFAVAGAGYGAWYLALEIRRLWQGDDLSVPGVSDGELYSYTVALILVSVMLLGLALVRRSETLRRVAMAGVALTVAKVFLVDMAGLSGLVRVASFLGLGLSLAGLAWLNRRIAEHMGRDPG
ncbi:putative membrane protein [Roseovarius mucosus DSM 17069]|uniref:Putative membrane protein n=1 Tax=Roseovarius mucosus DSM 17069 TaxID=1288298 RepID=A0A0A0HNQ4_9RHOB|nr:DUF2339 domain-containing protein [Roseovarius mucosus]KGM88566.1 putative membrane protein [Roseovarius mucosus DSM 17069]